MLPVDDDGRFCAVDRGVDGEVSAYPMLSVSSRSPKGVRDCSGRKMPESVRSVVRLSMGFCGSPECSAFTSLSTPLAGSPPADAVVSYSLRASGSTTSLTPRFAAIFLARAITFGW